MDKLKFRLLTNRQHILFATALIFAAVMIADTLYLLAAGYLDGVGKNPEVLPITYQVLLVIHIVLGIVFSVAAISFALSHLKKVFQLKTRGARMTGALMFSAITLLLLSGFFILSEANSRENQWIFISHQVGAGLLVLMYLVHRLLSRDPPRMASVMSGATLIGSMLAVAWLAHFIEAPDTPFDAEASASAPETVTYNSEQSMRALSGPAIVAINPFVPFFCTW